MGYLFLACALMAGLTKGFCGKKTSSFVSEYKDAAFSNMIRMFLCIIIGFGFVVVQSGVSGLLIDTKTFLISLMSGVFTSLFVVSWLLIVKRGAYMTVEVFSTIGTIIPIALCYFLYDEKVSLMQIGGIGILLIAVCIMCSYNNSVKGKMSASTLGLLLVCGAAYGLTDFSQKLFKYELQVDASVFNFYTYVVSFLCLTIFYLTVKKTGKENAGEKGSEKKLFKSIWGYILVMSLCLFLNSYFKTLAAEYLSSAQLYPLNQGAALILSSFMAAIFFKERINVKSVIGIILTFIALLFITKVI